MASGITPVLTDGVVSGLKVSISGHEFVLDDPSDEEGGDFYEDGNPPAFKKTVIAHGDLGYGDDQEGPETDDQKASEEIRLLGSHPEAMSAEYDDEDGDHVEKVWFLVPAG